MTEKPKLRNAATFASATLSLVLCACSAGHAPASADEQAKPKIVKKSAAASKNLTPGTALATGVLADSVTGFSKTQGSNNWSYGYWDRSADTDKTYNAETDFQYLQHFGDDSINKLSARTEFNTGPLWYQEDGLYYTSLWAEGGHPNAELDLGNYAQVEHWAVRRWESTVDGLITISGRAGKVMPWGANWSGVCEARIAVDSKVLYSAPMDNDGAKYSIDVAVRVGSSVDFLIGPGPSIGVTMFTATVREQQPQPTPLTPHEEND